MSDNADDMQKQFKVAQKGVVRKAVFAVLEGLFGVMAYGEPERQEECILIPIVKKRELELFASSLVMASDKLPQKLIPRALLQEQAASGDPKTPSRPAGTRPAGHHVSFLSLIHI